MIENRDIKTMSEYRQNPLEPTKVRAVCKMTDSQAATIRDMGTEELQKQIFVTPVEFAYLTGRTLKSVRNLMDRAQLPVHREGMPGSKRPKRFIMLQEYWDDARFANLNDTIKGNADITVSGALTEKITGIRRSVAAAQELIAPVVKLGSEEINVLTLLTDTLDVVNELARVCASHTHPSVGTSPQAGEFTAAAQKSTELKEKYSPLIA